MTHDTIQNTKQNKTKQKGTDLEDVVSWKEWWLPTRNQENVYFAPSFDCQTCAEGDGYTAYYMSRKQNAPFFFCFFVPSLDRIHFFFVSVRVF